MAGIQLTGLASGLDWKSLVDQIMAVNNVPVQRLQTEQTRVDQQSTVLGSLKTKLQALQESVTSLNAPAVFSQRDASVANPQWSVAAAPGATAMTHSINVTKLASAARLEGSDRLAKAIRADGDASQVLISAMNLAQPVTPGDFTVNGARVSVAITDTLSEVFQKISDATNGTVTASYDGTTDRVSLSSANPIVLGSANDSSNFLQALKLGNTGTGSVSSSSRLGTAKLDAPLASAGLAGTLALDGNNAGSFSVNGVPINFDADTDSLRTVISRINASSAGVNAAYDSTNDRIVLTNKVTGDLGLWVEDGSGNLASVLGLTTSATLVRGGNAEFSVDGGPVRTSASNLLDENALGVTGLSVTIGSETTEQITIGSNTTGAREKIEDFIKKFNEVLSYVDQQTKVTTSGASVTTALLYGDQSVKSVSTGLRGEIFKVLGGTGGIQRLEALGIDFNGTTNELKIKDSSKLDNALRTKAGDVSSFFTSSGTGFAARINSFVDRQIGASGSITKDAELKVQRKSKISVQISDLQRRLNQQRSSLEARFVQMERMQSLLKNQLQALNNAFPSKSNSDSSS